MLGDAVQDYDVKQQQQQTGKSISINYEFCFLFFFFFLFLFSVFVLFLLSLKSNALNDDGYGIAPPELQVTVRYISIAIRRLSQIFGF
jgi:hypothetical protein